jgi:cytosine/uracil/thiamine/allantoin permease
MAISEVERSVVVRNSRLMAILCARSSSRHFGTPIEHPVTHTPHNNKTFISTLLVLACVYVFICCNDSVFCNVCRI